MMATSLAVRRRRAPVMNEPQIVELSALSLSEPSGFIRMLYLFTLLPHAISSLVASIFLRLNRSIRQRGVCELCCSNATLVSGTDGACDHRCCSACWRRYFAVNETQLLGQARRRLSSRVVCCWGCAEPCDRVALRREMPSALIDICVQLDKREDFVQRGMRRNYNLVPCPECTIGVGYDDGQQPTAMCFLCEQCVRPTPLFFYAPPLPRRPIRKCGLGRATLTPVSPRAECAANGRWSDRPPRSSFCAKRATGS